MNSDREKGAPNFVTKPQSTAFIVVFAGTLEDASHCLYNKCVEYEWDEAKRQDNLTKHRGVDFRDMGSFECVTDVVD